MKHECIWTVFGLATLVFNGLEMAMHSMMQGTECLSDVVFVHPVLHGLFTFLQMHFLFVNSQVSSIPVTFYLCYKNYKNILINKIDWNIYIGSCREIRFSSEIRIHPFGCYKYCCLVSISYLGFCSRMDLFCSFGTTRFAQFSFPIESSRISRIFDKAYSRFDKYVLY